MAQLVRAPPCHGGGRGFEPHPGRLQFTSADAGVAELADAQDLKSVSYTHLDVYKRQGLMDKLHDCGKEFYFAPAHVNKQRAGAVGALALRYLEEGKTETAEEHQPEYLRMAQAERERAEKLAKGEGTC